MSNSEIKTFNLSEESRKQNVIFNIQSPLNTEYWIQIPCTFPLKMTTLNAFCKTGSFNIGFAKIHDGDTVLLADFQSIPISDDIVTITATSHASNNIEVGDTWYFVISNVTSATLAAIQIDFIRGYDSV